MGVGHLRHATVLVVDDEAGPRESLRMILSPLFEVLLARSGAEAFEVLRTTPVDVVTLDLNMPGLKGPELMRALRAEFPDVEVIVVTGVGTLESATEGIRCGVCDYIEKPFDALAITAAVYRALARRRGRKRILGFLHALDGALADNPEARALLANLERSAAAGSRLLDVLAPAGAAAASNDTGAREDRAGVLAFVRLLAETLESTDPFMAGHSKRVAQCAELLADRLCVGGEEREQLRLAALLHDVGKVGVPSEILTRPGALSPGERRIVERHPGLGARLLEPLGLGYPIVAAVRHHHEWWDGTGYPDGLHGEAIPLAARIIHVADAYDAMSRARPYRPPLARPALIEEFARFSGIQFDPALVRELLHLVEGGAFDQDWSTSSQLGARWPVAESAAPSA